MVCFHAVFQQTLLREVQIAKSPVYTPATVPLFGALGAASSGDNELHLSVPNLTQPALSYLSLCLSLSLNIK